MRSPLNGQVECVEIGNIVHLVDSPTGGAVEILEEGAESGFHWMGQTNILSGMMELGGSSISSGA